jgi:hypothetical protein
MVTQDKALLGLATTRQLLDEVRARIEIDRYRGGGGLEYRSTDDTDGSSGVIQMLFSGDLEDIDPALTRMLSQMGDNWGKLGVARAAVAQVWPDIPRMEEVIKRPRLVPTPAQTSEETS